MFRFKPKAQTRRTPRIGHAPVTVQPPVHPSMRPTAIPGIDSPALTAPGIEPGDTEFCSVGFRLFLASALRDMDAVFRQGVRYRAGLRQAQQAHRAEQWARRTARNQQAAAYASGGLTPSTSPRIAQTIVARALHASDDDAPTGLLPAVTA